MRWKMPGRKVASLLADTQHVVFWDSRINRYVAYFRVFVDKKSQQPRYPFVEPIASDPPVVSPSIYRPERAVGRLEIDDLLEPWPEQEIRTVLTADESDPPDSDIYTHYPNQYPHAADAYFLFPLTYQRFSKSESTTHNDGLNDCQFCASRDGIHWMRYNREPYIGRGLPGEPDCGQARAPEVRHALGQVICVPIPLTPHLSNWGVTSCPAFWRPRVDAKAAGDFANRSTLILAADRRQHLHRPHHRTIFVVQVRQTHRMDLVGAPELAVPIPLGEREAAVLHQNRIEPQISGHSNRRLHGVIRNYPRNDEHILLPGPQPHLQGGADECTICLLRDDAFARRWPALRLELISRLARAIQ